MLYIVSGRFRLVESGIELPVGAIVGEFGMLSPSNVRTQTLECIESGLILSVSYSKVEELYVQNPAFGFYFLRLASARLFQNIATLQRQLEQKTALLEAKQAREPGNMTAVSDVKESLRYLFADIIGERDDTQAYLPEGLPESVVPVASDAIHLLTEYQGADYAKLYVERLKRFVGKRGVERGDARRDRAADGDAHEL